MSKGFTLIEVMIVVSIILISSAGMIVSLGRIKVGLNQQAQNIVAQIRETQTWAASGVRFNNVPRCGYGVIGATPTAMTVFAGPDASNPGIDCTAQNRNYESGIDAVVKDVLLTDSKIEFKRTEFAAPGLFFQDIFFEPPDPKTFVNNNSGFTASVIAIGFKGRGVTCDNNPKECKVICVYTTGNIEARDYQVGNPCPGN